MMNYTCFCKHKTKEERSRKSFNWGKTSKDYAKYRDIYTKEFYQYIINLDYFKIVKQEEFRVDIPFTRDSWNGRMRACRGTSASMTSETFADWENEHVKMLEEYPEKFLIKHYISIAWLKKR